MANENTTITQVSQWGKESTPGTGVPATVKFDTFAVMPEPQADTRDYRPQGTKVATIVQETKEWMEAALTGWPSYVADCYLLSSLLGAASIGTVGVAGNQWVFTDDGVTPTNPITYTMEFGSAQRAKKWNYGALTDYGIKWKRDAVTSDGKIIGQRMTDGATLTSSGSVSRVAAKAVAPGDLNVYIDTASGSLGGTQYTSVYEVDFGVAGKFGPKWPANRANSSWESLVEIPAKWTLKLKAEVNTQGMNGLTWIRTGQTVFVRLQFQGGLLPGEAATNYLYQIDMAAQVAKIDKDEDEGGVWSTSYELTGVYDSGWGKVAVVTLNNKLAAL